ncbi:MAG: AAA family ATPase [Patescibacteria group bacterium]|jgi:predicted kinase
MDPTNRDDIKPGLRVKIVLKKDLRKASQESSEGKNLSDLGLEKISNQYEKTIKIPKIKPSRQLMICPIGLVGAGKTTILKPICSKLGLVRISTDEVRHLLKRGGYNYLRATEIAKILTAKYLDLGYSIAIDGDCIQPKYQKHFKKLAREHKILLIWIHVKPSEKFIINKLKKYNHTWLFKDSAEAMYNYRRRKLLHKAYLPSIDFYFKFDTSRDDLKNQIREFINKLKTDLHYRN